MKHLFLLLNLGMFNIIFSQNEGTQNSFDSIKSMRYWNDINYNIYLVKLPNIVSENYNKENLSLQYSSEIFQRKIKSVDYVERNYRGYQTDELKKYILFFVHKDTIIDSMFFKEMGLSLIPYWRGIPAAVYPNDYFYNPYSNDTTLLRYVGHNALYEHLNYIRAPEAWEITKGKRVTLGILDNYFNPNFYRAYMYKSGIFDFIPNPIIRGTQISNQIFNSTDDHGTRVASMLFLRNDNGIGGSSLLGFVNKNGKSLVNQHFWGTGAGVNLTQLKTFALNTKAKVINNSWVSSNPCFFNQPDQLAINEIVNIDKKILVFAAGNGDSCGKTSYVYPASYDNVISVSSIGHLDTIGHLSYPLANISWKNTHRSFNINQNNPLRNYTHQSNDKVDIVAPGYRIPTYFPIFYPQINQFDRYRIETTESYGTSFAAPLVSGTIALMLSLNPCLEYTEVENILKASANKDIYNNSLNSSYIGKLGGGRLDVYQALIETIKRGTVIIQKEIYLSNRNLVAATDMKICKSCDNTKPHGNVLVNSNIKFISNNSIEIFDGFEVMGGSTTELIVRDSPCYND
jgi:hypothetical protein